MARLLPGAVLLAAAACATTPPRSGSPPAAPTPPREIVVRLGPPAGGAAVETMALERYVAGIVAGELAIGQLPPEAAELMCQLQALLARTYALANLGRHRAEGFDVCRTTHCQVYRPPAALPRGRAAVVERGVAATAGRAITYRGRPILALFHSHCGGRTSAPEALWGGQPRPYLLSVDDSYCVRAGDAVWRFAVSKQALSEVLNRRPETRVGGTLRDISVVSRDAAERALALSLSGERHPLVRGEELRAALLAGFGAASLQSLRFTVRRVGDDFHFEGRGRGHGAGLCQSGAVARLNAGEPVAAIVGHYYPGAVISDLTASRLH